MIEVKIQATPLNLSECVAKVSDPASGGLVTFIGNTRNLTKGKKVIKLEFEAYEKMAEKEMGKIAQEAIERWNLNDMLIYHRTGTVLAGQTAVIIIAASSHRDEAFQACRFAIDTLKETVPIWKKEFFEDGVQWVTPHP